MSSERTRLAWDEMAKLAASLSALTRHIPPGQLGRYLIVGVWNTAFAYGTFALFTALLDRYMPASYLAGSLASSVLNITVSFLGYKWFVFKTKGNYLREWLRCLAVYSGSILLGLALLPPTVFAVAYITGDQHLAPYIAGALLMGVQVILSFVGHKNFSFRTGEAVDAPQRCPDRSSPP
jgi:putative flippase GtrA